jgi:hypothetical protein
MSMSTQHGGVNRRPSTVKPGGKPTTGAARAKSEAAEVEAAEADALAEVDEADALAEVDEAEAGSDEAADDEAASEAASDEEPAPRRTPRTASRSGTATSRPGKATASTKAGAASGRAGATKTSRSAGSARPGARPAGVRPATKAAAGKGGARKTFAPVKVSQGRNWGPIALFVGVAVLALSIIGYAAWQVHQNSRSFEERAADIPGVVNYIKTNPSLKQPAQHGWGKLTYPQSPPIGGRHNPNWQNCMGDVYDAQIANEHAVHALEHGAVWVTYNPEKLSKDQIATLAKKVTGQEYMLMSPYPGLDKPVSLQAWGFQLKLGSVTDKRIDQFIKLMRHTAGIENTAQCSGGITETGTTPRDLGQDAPAQPGG